MWKCNVFSALSNFRDQFVLRYLLAYVSSPLLNFYFKTFVSFSMKLDVEGLYEKLWNKINIWSISFL
jgi:hypothetical protein